MAQWADECTRGFPICKACQKMGKPDSWSEQIKLDCNETQRRPSDRFCKTWNCWGSLKEKGEASDLGVCSRCFESSDWVPPRHEPTGATGSATKRPAPYGGEVDVDDKRRKLAVTMSIAVRNLRTMASTCTGMADDIERAHREFLAATR